MAILINRTQNNFTMISNCIFHDQTLSMRDRGVFCMLCSLPDGWEFSIAGLSAISKDGKDSIRASVHVLEEKGYFVRNVHRNESGQFTTEIEIYPAGNTASDLPTRADRGGFTVTANPTETNTKDKEVEIKNRNKETTGKRSVVVPMTCQKSFQESENKTENESESRAKVRALFPDMKDEEIDSLLAAAGGDQDRIVKAKKVLDAQTCIIYNVTGWMLKAIREGYELREQKPASKPRNGFNEFTQKSDTDYLSQYGVSSWDELGEMLCKNQRAI